MSGHNLTLTTASKATLGVRQVSAHDQMGAPFSVDIIAQSQKPTTGYKASSMGPTVDLEAIVGRGAELTIITQDSDKKERNRVYAGICSHVEQIRFDDTDEGMSTYYLRLVPHLWLLSQRRGHRIYQHKSIPEIIKSLFEEWKLKTKWTIDDAVYPKKEYCLQYGESDLDFVNRLLEEAGITYHFAQDKDLLLLSDATWTAKKSLDIQYSANPNETGGTEFATQMRISHGLRTGYFTVSDFNFRRPKSPLFAHSGKFEGEEGSREIYAYEPGGFLVDTDDPGKGPKDEKVADNKSTTTHDHETYGIARAQRFLEASRHKKRFVAFETSHQNLTVGKVVTIEDHPHDELKGQRLMIIEAMTQVSAVGRWSVVVEAVFCDVPYRLPRRTAKPIVHGVQSAIVVGPKGKEIYTDEFGRVRVHFHWDRECDFDDNATCWLRVAQTWAGAQYGSMTVPRIGHEVIVDFLDGNPDHPLIVGRVHTGVAPSPYKLPDHKTRSGWQTNSTPNQKEQSFNEMSFEDNVDKELVYLQAQRNYMSLTKRNETERTGKKRLSVVGKHQLGVVGQVDTHHFGERKLVRMVSTSKKKLKILELGEPKTTPKDTWIEIEKPAKITLTTGAKKATIVLDGPNITVESHGGIRMSADRNFVIKGSMVYINAKKGDDAKPKTKQQIKDDAPIPEGDMLNSISQLFSKDKPRKVKRLAPKELKPQPLQHGLVVPPSDVTCELISEAVMCQHNGRTPSDKGLLQVAAPVTGDTITLDASYVGGCDNHPLWTIGGFWSSTKKEAATSFKALAVRTGDPSPAGEWLAGIVPKTYQVRASACKGSGKSYRIEAYPDDRMRWAFTIAEWQMFDGAKKALEKFFQSWMPKFKIRSTGKFQLDAQWKEWSDHRCYYSIDGQLAANPLIGIEARFPFGPTAAIPAWLKKFGDAYLFIEFYGNIHLRGHWSRISPDESDMFLEGIGQIGLKVGASIHLMSPSTVTAEVDGRTYINLSAKPDHNVDDPKAMLSLTWKGLRAVVTIKFWDRWEYRKDMMIIGEKTWWKNKLFSLKK